MTESEKFEDFCINTKNVDPQSLWGLCMRDGWQARQPEIDALKAEVERLRQDAERYRWLRREGDWPFDSHEWALGEMSYEEFDRYVDAAMSALPDTKGDQK